jgi:lysophospholipase L1-like esterase
MQKQITWCAIGDSFTYLNDHLDETGYRLKKGYLTRSLSKLSQNVRLVNMGINGSATTDWLAKDIADADLYTVLLGTNDWFSRHTPLGGRADYEKAVSGTILGNLACIIRNIRRRGPSVPILVMNPVERGDFVCITNIWNMAHGSYREENGVALHDVSNAIFRTVRGEGIIPVDLYTRSGFIPSNAVKFKRLRINGVVTDVTYPNYIDIAYHQEKDPYPYPEEAAWMTYDGLHPSDLGSEAIALVLSDEINRILPNL